MSQATFLRVFLCVALLQASLQGSEGHPFLKMSLLEINKNVQAAKYPRKTKFLDVLRDFSNKRSHELCFTACFAFPKEVDLASPIAIQRYFQNWVSTAPIYPIERELLEESVPEPSANPELFRKVLFMYHVNIYLLINDILGWIEPTAPGAREMIIVTPAQEPARPLRLRLLQKHWNQPLTFITMIPESERKRTLANIIDRSPWLAGHEEIIKNLFFITNAEISTLQEALNNRMASRKEKEAAAADVRHELVARSVAAKKAAQLYASKIAARGDASASHAEASTTTGGAGSGSAATDEKAKKKKKK